VALERINKENRLAGMFWISGPKNYKTNNLLSKPQKQASVYWNVANLRSGCIQNLGRAATHLRLVLHEAVKTGVEPPSKWSQIIQNLDQLLKAYSAYLEPLAKRALKNKIGLDI